MRGAALRADLFAATFFTAPFLVIFFAANFFPAVFLAAVFFTGLFLATALRAVFLTAPFLAVFLAALFLAVVFLAVFLVVALTMFDFPSANLAGAFDEPTKGLHRVSLFIDSARGVASQSRK